MPARPEPLTASERSLRARMAAHARHARDRRPDRRHGTRP